jgi:YHS domain-containing protein
MSFIKKSDLLRRAAPPKIHRVLLKNIVECQDDYFMRRWIFFWLAIFSMVMSSGCASTHATYQNSSGDQVMLLGYDPVAYFRSGQPVKGRAELKHSVEGRTYWFADAANRTSFIAAPQNFEPQYGGFCANGAAYGMKWASNPTSFEVFNGKLYIFSGWGSHSSWLLHKPDNVVQADLLWNESKDTGWRWQSLRRMVQRVAHYRSNDELQALWESRFPNTPKPASQNGGFWANFSKPPGWQAAEGFGQAPVGWPD